MSRLDLMRGHRCTTVMRHCFVLRRLDRKCTSQYGKQRRMSNFVHQSVGMWAHMRSAHIRTRGRNAES